MGLITLATATQLLNTFIHRNPDLPVKPDLSMVEFGLPEPYVLGTTNTRIPLNAKADNGYFSGSTYLYYTRLDLGVLLDELIVPGTASDYGLTSEVGVALAEHYHLPLKATDFEVAPVAMDATIELKANPRSLGVIGTVLLLFSR